MSLKFVYTINVCRSRPSGFTAAAMDVDAAALGCVKAAAEAAKSGGTAQGAMIMKELAGLTSRLTHRPLQHRVATAVLRDLQTIEQLAKECVGLFVDALMSPQPSSEHRPAD